MFPNPRFETTTGQNGGFSIASDPKYDGVKAHLEITFTFWWDDENLDESVEDLRNALSVYLDEELGTEDW